MLWRDFKKMYELELYEVWCRWIPMEEKPLRKPEIVSTVISYIGQQYYDRYEEELVWKDDEFMKLEDDGTRITSFRDFVCCAYENM